MKTIVLSSQCPISWDRHGGSGLLQKVNLQWGLQTTIINRCPWPLAEVWVTWVTVFLSSTGKMWARWAVQEATGEKLAQLTPRESHPDFRWGLPEGQALPGFWARQACEKVALLSLGTEERGCGYPLRDSPAVSGRVSMVTSRARLPGVESWLLTSQLCELGPVI